MLKKTETLQKGNFLVTANLLQRKISLPRKHHQIISQNSSESSATIENTSMTIDDAEDSSHSGYVTSYTSKQT